MDEDELRELQDPSSWDFERAEVVPPAENAGAVIAVRFAADDFARIAQRATEAKMGLTAFIRDAVLEKVAQPTIR